MPIKIGYAMIDVRGDRANLNNRVAGGEKVAFTITGYMTNPMNDDGTSQEFAAIITEFAVHGEEGRAPMFSKRVKRGAP